jgi:hypothetical protein
MLKSVYDTNNDGISDHAALADTALWTGITGKPASFTPSAHGTTHITGGSDIIPIATSSATGLVPALPADTTKFLRGDGTFAQTAVSTDVGNIASLGSDSLILVPQNSIFLMRLRSFNAVGNSTFEVDQRNVGNMIATGNLLVIDRWTLGRTGTMGTSTGQQDSASAPILVPGTNFAITRKFFRVTLTTQESTLAAGDYLVIQQTIEGPQLRELISDVHSLSILVRSSVAGLKFSLGLSDPTGSRSLNMLCTISSANTWTLIQLANIPIFPSAGTFSLNPGSAGYLLRFGLAIGSTYIPPANSTWQNGNFHGAVGMSNFAASPVNSTFDIAYISHEPGPVCSTPMDCPFTGPNGNYEACLRYYCKSAPYGSMAGSASNSTSGICTAFAGIAAFPRAGLRWPKEMAKTPTVTVWNPAGVGNAVSIDSGSATVSATAADISTSGLGTLSVPSGMSIGQQAVFQWSADTGW